VSQLYQIMANYFWLEQVSINERIDVLGVANFNPEDGNMHYKL
jgi:hypothetical protein